jgi:hypothetical protein
VTEPVHVSDEEKHTDMDVVYRLFAWWIDQFKDLGWQDAGELSSRILCFIFQSPHGRGNDLISRTSSILS